jgi:hypothetical protein
MQVHAVNRPELPPLEMPARFKHDVAYFMTPPGEHGAPAKMPSDEFWIEIEDARRWLDDGVLLVYSPLDSTKQAEIALTQEQEDWLEWIVANQINHIRLV